MRRSTFYNNWKKLWRRDQSITAMKTIVSNTQKDFQTTDLNITGVTFAMNQICVYLMEYGIVLKTVSMTFV